VVTGYASRMKILINHPFFLPRTMPMDWYVRMAERGAHLELCANICQPMAFHQGGGMLLQQAVDLINGAGVGQCVVATDAGQPYSPWPDEELRAFMNCLYDVGLTETDINLEPLMKGEKEDIKARFTKGDLDSFTDDKGDHFFLPYSTGPMGLIYNAKAFQDAGLDPNRPPQTWEELLDYAKKLTKGNQYGIGLFGKGDNSSVWRLWYWWMSNGGNVLTPDGKRSAINSPEFVEAVDFWADLYRKHKVAPPSVPANSFGENNQLLAQGVVAMVESGVWQFGVTEKINPAIKGQLRAAPMPTRKVKVAVGGGTDSLCITKSSTHVKEAWELLKFLSDEQSGVTVWKIHGKFPANVRAMQRPELRSDPLVAAFEPMIQVARTPFKSTKYVEITQALGVMQQEVLTGAKPTAVAVKGASDRIDAILRD
jgi:ABC-type glycerol-3-phosphate transport system substrate-binding protein